MQNKTPIVVLTGLGIVAAAAVAGLTRDQWMGQKPEVVATAPAPEAPKTPDQPAATPEAPKPVEQPAATAAPAVEQPATPAAPSAEQPAAEAPKPADLPASSAAPSAEQPATAAPKAETGQQTAAAQPAAPAADTSKIPAFDTVRVEKTGEAVIAGTAPAGSDVVVMLDGKVIGETSANSSGAFVVIPDQPLPAGSGALTLAAKGKDDAAATPSEQSVAVIVPAANQPQEALVAVVSPDQPTKVLQKPEVKPETTPSSPQPATTAEKPSKLVSIDAVDYDAAGNIVFSGQGNEGNTARLYIDNNIIGDAPVGADGRWSFSGTADVAPGVHTLRVDGLDSAGKVVNRVEVPFFREQPNKVADATKPATTTAVQPDGTTTPESDPTTTAPAKPTEGRVVIQPGNNLWRISRVLYGAGAKFTTIYEANKDQIRNPDRIYPGQVFKTPDVAAASESIDPKRRAPLKPDETAAPGQ